MSVRAPRLFVVRLKNLDKWQVPRAGLIPPKLPKEWRIVRVADFAQQITERVRVEHGKQYKMLGVKWYGEGVFLRETVQGDSMSAQWVMPAKPGAFIYNRLFAWKESFAVVPPELTGCFVSSEFPQFIVDSTQISAEYLNLLFRLRSVINAVNAASAGSAAVSRNRFKEIEFLRMELPIPPLETQRDILAKWQNAKAKIAAGEQNARRIQNEQDVMFLRNIGVLVDTPSQRHGAFHLQLMELERWDTFFYRPDFISLEHRLRTNKARPLGELLHFVCRPWKSADFASGTFQYIEISNVTREDGIVGSRPVDCAKAPSRATTLVKTGDILISTTRPYLGAFTRVNPEFDGYVCSSGFALADRVTSDMVNPDYVVLFLKSEAGLRQMERRMSGGLYPAIVQSELEKILIPLPPLSTQCSAVQGAQDYRARIASARAAALDMAEKIEADLESWLLGTKPIAASKL